MREKEGAASLTKVTIPEGYTLLEIAEKLEQKRIIQDKNHFLAYVQKKGRDELLFQFPFLAQIPTKNLEGYMFPDTYIFAQGISHQKILAHFLQQFALKVLPIWEQNPLSMGLHKTLTLASIVEKEAYKTLEMNQISGVYHNRLKRHMILASCPTVAYAMGDPRRKFLTYSDLKYKSIYNTYLHKGLPPTPIASPGVSAFAATLNPKQTPYLYFVSNGDGTHQFSTTLKAHLQKQQAILKKQGKLKLN